MFKTSLAGFLIGAAFLALCAIVVIVLGNFLMGFMFETDKDK